MSAVLFVVLLIEDDRREVQLFTALCHEVTPSTEVRAVSSGQEAINILRRGVAGEADFTLPQLIALDLGKPTVNGQVFLDGARLSEEVRQIPTIALSAPTLGRIGTGLHRPHQDDAGGRLLRPSTSEDLTGLVEVVTSY